MHIFEQERWKPHWRLAVLIRGCVVQGRILCLLWRHRQLPVHVGGNGAQSMRWSRLPLVRVQSKHWSVPSPATTAVASAVPPAEKLGCSDAPVL